jgi:hypothetical protein
VGRTIKLFGEEVAAAEIIAHITGKGAPPSSDAKTLAVMMALESRVLSGGFFRTGREQLKSQISVQARGPASELRRSLGRELIVEACGRELSAAWREPANRSG